MAKERFWSEQECFYCSMKCVTFDVDFFLSFLVG